MVGGMKKDWRGRSVNASLHVAFVIVIRIDSVREKLSTVVNGLANGAGAFLAGAALIRRRVYTEQGRMLELFLARSRWTAVGWNSLCGFM